MKREIKFKARSIEKSNKDFWVFGDFEQHGFGGKPCIVSHDGIFCWEVDGTSVCQFTGQRDIMGQAIYEGDIFYVKVDPQIWPKTIPGFRDQAFFVVVIWNQEKSCFCGVWMQWCNIPEESKLKQVEKMPFVLSKEYIKAYGLKYYRNIYDDGQEVYKKQLGL